MPVIEVFSPFDVSINCSKLSERRTSIDFLLQLPESQHFNMMYEYDSGDGISDGCIYLVQIRCHDNTFRPLLIHYLMYSYVFSSLVHQVQEFDSRDDYSCKLLLQPPCFHLLPPPSFCSTVKPICINSSPIVIWFDFINCFLKD